jgi:Ca2+-binding EF-hand superfamily protein
MSTDWCGAFWERKISSWFARNDTDHDGVITEKGFEHMVDRYRVIGGASPEKEAQIQSVLKGIWTTYFEAESLVQPITAKVYCDSLRKLGRERLVGVVKSFFSLYFDIIDTNEDDLIQKEEFEVFFKVFGMDPSTAAESFLSIDTDGDGVLSRDEFVAASVDFCTTNDESSKFNNFCGPLLC